MYVVRGLVAGGCGGDTAGDVVIGVSLLTRTHPFYQDLEAGLRAAAAEHGYELIIQAGTYGEHDFTQVRCTQSGSAVETISVDDRHLMVYLPPGSTLDLTAGLARFRNRPSYRLPWS